MQMTESYADLGTIECVARKCSAWNRTERELAYRYRGFCDRKPSILVVQRGNLLEIRYSAHRYVPCVFGLIHSSRRSVILGPYQVQFAHGMRMSCLPYKRRRSTLVTCRAWTTLGASIITSWTRTHSNATVNEGPDSELRLRLDEAE